MSDETIARETVSSLEFVSGPMTATERIEAERVILVAFVRSCAEKDAELTRLRAALDVTGYVARTEALLTRATTAEAECERLRAALETMRLVAGDAHAHWDAGNDVRVGKLLIAMSGGCRGYRADIDTALAALTPQPVTEAQRP